ncbi:MAG: glycine/sarcosine/betaine reductase selenoprotein B family protein [Acidimicrobiales bacterium]
MEVDGTKFLPRSFQPLYANPAPLETGEAWAAFEPRLADATVGMLTSAGMYATADQHPFDLDGERADPSWGDPSWRALPADLPADGHGVCHLHINTADIEADREVALPLDGLHDAFERGVVGGVAPTHYSVMGFQKAGLDAWRETTAPAIIERLRSERVDGLILAPV